MNKSKIIPLGDEIIKNVCKKHNIRKSDIFRKTREENIILARNEAIMELRYNLGYTLKRIGDKFNIEYSTVWHILKKGGMGAIERFTRENKIYIMGTHSGLDEVLYPMKVK